MTKQLPETRNSTKDISPLTLAASGLLLAGALGYGGHALHEHSQNHPAEYPGGVDDVRKSLGVDPNSAPAIGVKPGELPSAALETALPEGHVIMAVPNEQI
jgi:hypothetical protein